MPKWFMALVVAATGCVAGELSSSSRPTCAGGGAACDQDDDGAGDSGGSGDSDLSGDPDASDNPDDDTPADPCSGVTCSGHGSCSSSGGPASCTCQNGYHAVGLLCASDTSAELPAFPGAQGFGAVARGGRGGEVVIVDTLASSGPGSLREALEEIEGPRIVVFRVSGVIEGDLTISHGYVTIAGQTAPGGGITVRGRIMTLFDYDESPDDAAVKDIIIRHVRIRPPVLETTQDIGEDYDGLQINRNGPAIVDHVSVSWSSDETIDLYRGRHMTVQWTSIEESAESGHPEGTNHNYGFINGPDGHAMSFHHNLCAHHLGRCPAVATGPIDVINNLAYDVLDGFHHHNDAEGEFHVIGNYFRDGPSAALSPVTFDDEGGGVARYYFADNYVDDPSHGLDAAFDDVSDFADTADADTIIDDPDDFFAADPTYVPITTHASESVLDVVTAKVGAFPRDVVTERTLDEVMTRTGEWGAHDEGGDLMEGLLPVAPPADDDRDGMADDWELSHCLEPTLRDHLTLMPSGYTAIEEYINELADLLVGDPVTPGGCP